MLKLFLAEITDLFIRKNFEKIADAINKNVLLSGQWRFVEITFTGAATNFRYKHNLNFAPKDVIQTSLIGAGTITWNYDRFNSDYLDITTSGALTVRAFVGRYDNA